MEPEEFHGHHGHHGCRVVGIRIDMLDVYRSMHIYLPYISSIRLPNSNSSYTRMGYTCIYHIPYHIYPSSLSCVPVQHTYISQTANCCNWSPFVQVYQVYLSKPGYRWSHLDLGLGGSWRIPWPPWGPGGPGGGIDIDMLDVYTYRAYEAMWWDGMGCDMILLSAPFGFIGSLVYRVSSGYVVLRACGVKEVMSWFPWWFRALDHPSVLPHAYVIRLDMHLVPPPPPRHCSHIFWILK